MDWLDAAVREARFDQRPPLREASWFAAGQQPDWFDEASARYALRDENARVRIAALDAWRQQGPDLPGEEARRLAEDQNFGVRLALIRLLAMSPNTAAQAQLCRDPDGYVRGIARKKFHNEGTR